MLCDIARFLSILFILPLVTTDSKKTAEKPQSDSAAEKSQLSKRRRRTKKDAEKEVKPAVIGSSQLTIFVITFLDSVNTCSIYSHEGVCVIYFL